MNKKQEDRFLEELSKNTFIAWRELNLNWKHQMEDSHLSSKEKS